MLFIYTRLTTFIVTVNINCLLSKHKVFFPAALGRKYSFNYMFIKAGRVFIS